MIRALVWKELCETAGIAAIILVVGLAFVAGLAGWPLFASLIPYQALASSCPFDNFTLPFELIAAGFPVALAFRQSAVEPTRGTALYLLHRPLGRSAIVITKVATGLALQTVVLSIPIAIYGSWLATPGNYPAPFEWSMTGSAFRVVLAMPVVYLAAFSSGIYEARWIGGRLLPLLAAIIPVILMLNVPWWWVFGSPVVLLVSAWFISDILLEARIRDF